MLLCSDLFQQTGAVEPVTTADVLGRWERTMAEYQAHPVLMDYMPFTPQTRSRLDQLASLEPRMLAAMHGSTFVGDAGQALRAAGDMLERQLVREAGALS